MITNDLNKKWTKHLCLSKKQGKNKTDRNKPIKVVKIKSNIHSTHYI